jgi:hypothetical protein
LDLRPGLQTSAEMSGATLRNNPVIPSVVGLLLAVAVVGLHLLALGADPSVFVRAAPPLADPLRVPSSLRTMNADHAYDGEFFYRLAVDPLLVRDVGITLDGPSYRQQRLLYPLLVGALSFGQETWVPWLLIVVNVVGLAVLGFLGARYVVATNRAAWLGIALPLYVGFSYTLARDLSEIVEACLVTAMLLAWQTRRVALAALCMCLAVLARETAVVLAVALLAAWVWERVRSPSGGRTSMQVLVGVAGVACYLAVQITLWLRWGVLPTAAGAGNLALPFSGPMHYLGTTGRLGWLEFVWFITLVGAALLNRSAPTHIRFGIVSYVVMLNSLSSMVWDGDAAWLRAASEASILAWLCLFHVGGRRLLTMFIASGALWPAVVRWAITT